MNTLALALAQLQGTPAHMRVPVAYGEVLAQAVLRDERALHSYLDAAARYARAARRIYEDSDGENDARLLLNLALVFEDGPDYPAREIDQAREAWRKVADAEWG